MTPLLLALAVFVGIAVAIGLSAWLLVYAVRKTFEVWQRGER